MAQYDRYVIGKLLDTYESSLLSTGENRRNIHIEFRFTKKGVPAYFDESSSEYERIHFFMESLEEKQLLRICWQGKRKGHIIAKVQLHMEKLEEKSRLVVSSDEYLTPDGLVVEEIPFFKKIAMLVFGFLAQGFRYLL